MNDEEKINKKLLDDLKDLPKVEAPKNFETELWRKINLSAEEKKISFWDKLFSPGKLAPAAIAVASAVIIFFVVDITPEQMEDPLSIQPRLREDFVVVETMNIKPVEMKKEPVVKKEQRNEIPKGIEEKVSEIQSIDKKDESTLSNTLEKKSTRTIALDELSLTEVDSGNKLNDDQAAVLGGNVVPAPVSSSANEISRNSLNFMQRSLSTAEKDEVQQLKMKVSTQKSGKTDENRTNPTQK